MIKNVDVVKSMREGRCGSFGRTAFGIKASGMHAHPHSDKLVAEFLEQKKAGKDDIVGINTMCFSSQVYIAGENTPTTKVGIDRCLAFPEERYKQLAEQFDAVPYPRAQTGQAETIRK